jgi:hypothetical protein
MAAEYVSHGWKDFAASTIREEKNRSTLSNPDAIKREHLRRVGE